MRPDNYHTRVSALTSARAIAFAKRRHNLVRSIDDELHRIREDAVALTPNFR